ncbi:CRISPR-associated helicase Cas3' [Parabacteroides chinchillae]
MISHLKLNTDNQWIIQSNEKHCNNVSILAQRFSEDFKSGIWGKFIGLLHDLGKENPEFQRYISGVSGYKPEFAGNRHVNHAYVGALAARKIFPKEFFILSYCIMGHHAGLPDCGNFDNTMKSPFPKDVTVPFYKENTLPLPFQLQLSEIHIWIRMLFSCLVDADYLDTEEFMNEEQSKLRKNKAKLHELLPPLKDHLYQLKKHASDTPLNKIREEIQKKCFDAASIRPGFFSLTVPTGGGKTLSSLVWAINHALKYGKKRVIIAIPYTSIIVQTAQILRDIFGPENVLEHHSNTIKETYANPKLQEQMKLATENWDAPIIVTTNVQLFESLFSNRPSKCRKLHNICNSIIILDEVQTLPLNYLRPIIDCLKALQNLFGTSILFTTASQSAIDGDIRCGKSNKDHFDGIQNIHEIISDPEQLSVQLRRVQIHMDTDISNYNEIAERIARHKRVLCIVNTRADAKEIYTRLPEDEFTFHLSRMMCPVHIRETIKTLKKALLSEDIPIIRVVATQLIEAGVDIDFPVVFRQEAGLDSIIQAAGRCNREGKLKSGNTYVFKLEKTYRGSISLALSALKRLNKESDWLSPDTIKSYFKHLYYNINSFDEARICDALYTTNDFYFKTAADNFRLIDNKGIGVIVNYQNSIALIERLKSEGPSYQLMKELNQYTVHVYEEDLKKFCKYGLIEEILEGIFFLSERKQYDPKIGLALENHWLEEILTI